MQSQTSFNLDNENFLLKKKKKQQNILMFVGLFFIFGIAVFYVVYKYLNSISYNLFLELLAFELVCGIVVTAIISRQYLFLKKDLQEKIKNIYTGKITDKKEETSENSSLFFIFLENEKFGVEKDWYEKFNIGDDVILEQANRSKVLLNISKKV